MDRARFVLCDVFAEQPFAGNQLAVFTHASAIPEPHLGLLAREFNFSEVTFVYQSEGNGDARIRIFTPISEIPFAGHPVLGSAVVVAAGRQSENVTLETGVGLIHIRIERSTDTSAFGWMQQPTPLVSEFELARDLLAVLGVESILPVEMYDNGMKHVFIALQDEAAVAALQPDFEALGSVIRASGDHVGVNCFAGHGVRWKTRMFAPTDGVPEDPATGSAAGPLACHLLRHLRIEPNQEILIAQGVEVGRPSRLHARVVGDHAHIEGVEVGGRVHIVGEGELVWPAGD